MPADTTWDSVWDEDEPQKAQTLRVQEIAVTAIDSAHVAVQTPAQPPTEPCLFPCLMPVATPTLIRLPANLVRNLRVLPMILARTAADGGVLEMFGPGVGMPVTVLMGAGRHAKEDFYALGQISSLLKAQSKHPEKSENSVRLLHHSTGGPRLSDEEGRRAVHNELPAGSILIIYDLAGWTGRADNSSDVCSAIMEWLGRLCADGHAAVVFEPSEVAGDSLIKLIDPDDVIEVAYDPGAPYDHSGGGCILQRERRGIYDELPLRWNFWYRVQEGHLSWGMQVRDWDDVDALSEHEREVLLRQIDVAKGIKRGTPQNKLADELKVSASTICRDVKELKKQGRIP